MELLLRKGADPDICAGHHGTALQAAAYRGFGDIVDVLLEHGANVDIQGGAKGSAIQAALNGHDGPNQELADFLRSRSRSKLLPTLSVEHLFFRGYMLQL